MGDTAMTHAAAHRPAVGRDRAGPRRSLCESASTARNAVEVGRRAAKLLTHGPTDRVAIYRLTREGLALVVAYRGDQRWEAPPTVEPMPPAFSPLERRSDVETMVTLPEEAGPFSGAMATGIRTDDQLVGVLIVERAPASPEDAVDLSLTKALLGSRLRMDEDRREVHRLREERYEQMVRAETLAATGMLSAGVAHELNNPLNVVMGLAELMVLDDTLEEHVRADARLIVEEAGRAVTVIRQLLSYGRGGGIELEPVDVREILDCCASVFEAATATPRITVERRFTERPIVLPADPFRLQQAVLAILDNARLAIADTEAAEGRVIITLARQDSGEVIIEFTDSGAGIDPGVIPRVFDPFFTTREPGEGSGMGLALVHRAVRDMGGHIECENSPDGGARFRITVGDSHE